MFKAVLKGGMRLKSASLYIIGLCLVFIICGCSGPFRGQASPVIVFASTSQQTFSGEYIITCFASDGENRVNRDITVTVLDITDFSVQTGAESANLSWTMPNTQVVYDSLELTWSGPDSVENTADVTDLETYTVTNLANETLYTFLLRVKVNETDYSLGASIETATTDAGPIAAFTHTPSVADPGEDVVFIADQSAGSNLSYFLDFGDNTTDSGSVLINHTYNTEGSYQVTLTIIDDQGRTDSITEEITIADNISPVLTVSQDIENPLEDEEITFTAAGSDADGDNLTYSWEFHHDSSTQTGAQATYSYTAGGTYYITASVSDGIETVSELFSVTVTEVNDLSVAEFSISVTGMTASFSNTSSDPDDGISTCRWDFGDGGSSLTNGVLDNSHAYNSVGTYTVRLTVTDNFGDTSFVEHSVHIVETNTPVPGGGTSNINVIHTTDTSATLQWNLATDVDTPLEQLEYQVYYTNNYTHLEGSVSQIQSLAQPGPRVSNRDWAVVPDLVPDLAYYYTVLVNDPDSENTYGSAVTNGSPTVSMVNGSGNWYVSGYDPSGGLCLYQFDRSDGGDISPGGYISIISESGEYNPYR
ncbi:MAG: PKD domain-containing protein [Spirochaetia bacterium]